MKLNNRIPTLPKWPALRYDEAKQEYSVSCKHVSYRRYMFARFFAVFVSVGYFLWSFWFSFKDPEAEDPLYTFAFLFGPFFLFASIFPLARTLCRLFFPCRMHVQFKPVTIILNGKAYDVGAGPTIQFRASRPYLPQAHYEGMKRMLERGMLTSGAAYKLNFIKVEMLYGARLVEVTSIAFPERAEQIALTLQAAYEMSRSNKQKPPVKRSTAIESFEDILAE